MGRVQSQKLIFDSERIVICVNSYDSINRKKRSNKYCLVSYYFDGIKIHYLAELDSALRAN